MAATTQTKTHNAMTITTQEYLTPKKKKGERIRHAFIMGHDFRGKPVSFTKKKSLKEAMTK